MNPQIDPLRSRSQTSTLCKALLAALAVGLMLFGDPVQAANVLANASMESGLSTAWTVYGRTGQEGWYSYALASIPDPTVTGNNSFKVYAAWNGDPNFGGIYQDAACLPTSVFSANGWFRTKSNDKITGSYGAGTTADNGITCWLEVTFRDATGQVLALFKSAVFDGAWAADQWFAMPVTNQCDLVTTLPTGPVSTLVAPAGTVKVRYQVVLKQSAWAGGGALFADDMVLDQISGPTAPAIDNISPGAMLMANAANGLSFSASSASGTTINDAGIQVTINGSNVSAGLAITGTTTSKNVSYSGLLSNQAYVVSIEVTDALALVTTATLSFDTWSPLYVVEAEDYDFNGGQFIQNSVLSSLPGANSYFGQSGYQDVDFNDLSQNGDHLYRASDLMATTGSGDISRKQYLEAKAIDPLINDYKVGWFNGGEWLNYTRNFPAGTYNVYARLAGGAGAAWVNFGKVTEGWGTGAQTVTNLGTFSFTGVSWSSYEYVPLKDSNGNLVPLSLSGTNTLRVTTGGGADANFFMLVAADTNRPIISAVYPDGTTLLQNTNTFSFSVSSAAGGINNNSIGLTMNGVDVSASLVISGSANNKSVSYPGLLPNVPNYVAVIAVTNANGRTATTTARFDTFKPSLYSWELEDWDYGNAQFYDNPQTDAYVETIGTQGVDCYELFVNTPQVAYRSADPMGTDKTGDVPRARYAGTNDYNLGWFTAGEWVNYTRHFPAGNYHAYGRFSRGTGTNAAPVLSMVTSGVGTPEQTIVNLGSFSVDSHGWGSYAWVLMKDTSGTPVKLSFNGSGTTTLRLSSAGPEANTEANGNFVMLVPVANPVSLSASLSGGTMHLSFPTESGFSYQIQYKANLSDLNWTDLGAAIIGNGASKSSDDSAAQDQRFYQLKIQ